MNIGEMGLRLSKKEAERYPVDGMDVRIPDSLVDEWR